MKWISYLTVTLFVFSAQAREWFEAYTNARSNAMGGVKLAMTADDTSLFRNPASLASFRGGYVTLLDPEAEVSSGFSSSFSGIQTDVVKVKDLLINNLDRFYHAKLQLTPSLTLRNFSFGLIYKSEISAIINSQAPTQMDTIYNNDIGVALGYTKSFWDGSIKLGAVTKMINRVEIDNPILDTTTSLELDQIASNGSAIGFDASIQLQAAIKYFPTLVIMGRDLGNLEFKDPLIKSVNTSLRPQKVLQSVDVGFSFQPLLSRSVRSLFSFEYVDVSNSRQDDFSNKRIHAGAEFNWNDIFYFRLGVNQLYWTTGIEIATERLSWQVTTYGEEVGVKDNPKEDRRISTKIAFRF